MLRQVALGELLDLLLVGRHALEPRNRRDHLQQQVQLGVLGHHRLHEDRAPLGVDAGADPVGDVVDRVGDELRGVGVVAGQRVPVGDEVEAVVVALQRHPVLERADQVPEVQLPGRAHARHHALPVHSSQPRMRRYSGPIRVHSTPVSISA